MSADRLNSILTDSEINTFVEEMEALPSYKGVEEVMCEEMIEAVKATAFSAVRRAIIELGVMRTRQYHHIPLSGSRLQVLLNFDTPDKDNHPQRFRATTNEVREIKGEIRSVDIEDFAVSVNSLSVARRRSPQLVKGPPSDPLAGTLPILWKCTDGRMTRYAGSGYEVGSAGPLNEMSFSTLTQQLENARALHALLFQLSREVTLEEEYPY